MSVTLLPGAVEYIHWTVTGLPTDPPPGVVEVSIDDGATWHTGTLVGSEVRLLVAHPATVAPDPDAVVAAAGSSRMLVRITDTPEVVPRAAGTLRCA